MAKKKSFGVKLFRSILIIFLALVTWGGWIAYQNLIKNNVKLDGKKTAFFYVKTNSTYQELLNDLQDQGIIINLGSFDWLARKLNLDKEFKPGRYRISPKMTNRQIINMIKKGKQEKVTFTFNYTDRTKEQIIEKISTKLEISSSELVTFFNDEAKLLEMGFNKETIRALFLPKTYELNWNTSLKDFLKLIETYYKNFWTIERKEKAKKMNYSEAEIITLASIVQCESTIKSEQCKIAGVYLNRIHKKMQLQADPTLIFASGNFNTHRVLNADKKIESPYNTYKYFGLPPGPICLPYNQAIDAVLNHEKHNYIFFCAKPDLKGYSNFSVSYAEHKKFAEAYQKEMDRRGIKR
jgi:UPF0755 protein